MTNTAITNRFSVSNFNGDELAAYNALVAHQLTLTVGSRVQSTNGRAGVTGVVTENREPGARVYVRDEDGLTWELEARNLELAD